MCDKLRAYEASHTPEVTNRGQENQPCDKLCFVGGGGSVAHSQLGITLVNTREGGVKKKKN